MFTLQRHVIHNGVMLNLGSLINHSCGKLLIELEECLRGVAMVSLAGSSESA